MRDWFYLQPQSGIKKYRKWNVVECLYYIVSGDIVIYSSVHKLLGLFDPSQMQ